MFSNVLIPALHISQGSPREALSIPAQQVARIVNADLPITSEQLENIGSVFSVDAMKNSYNPINADPVKNTYNKHADSESQKEFLATWLQLFVEYPSVCVSATLMNYYGFFYPSSSFEHYDYGLEASYEEADAARAESSYFDFQYSNSGMTYLFGKIQTAALSFWRTAPILSILTTGAFYSWLLFFSLLYWRKRNIGVFSALLIPLLVLCVTLIGPCNDQIRYVYPFAFTMPFIGLFFASKLRV